MTPALRCACALALTCLAVLLQRPEGALGEETQLQQPREPRAAYWLSTFGQLNKYLEKLFHGSSKSKNTKKSKGVKNPKKTANSTQIPPANATATPPPNPAGFPPQNPTTPPRRTPRNPDHRFPPRVPDGTSQPGPSWHQSGAWELGADGTGAKGSPVVGGRGRYQGHRVFLVQAGLPRPDAPPKSPRLPTRFVLGEEP